MTCKLRTGIVPSLTVLLALGSPVLHAQAARTGGGPNVQLLQQLQQLASERTSMQADQARLEKELSDTKKERDTLKAAQQALQRRAQDATAVLDRANSQRQNSEQELTQTKAKLQELVAKFRETAQNLRDMEMQSVATKQDLAARDREYKACVDRNTSLYRLDDEVLTRLDKQGFWTRVSETEPFTRLKRIQLENFVDEERARAKDQRVTPDSSKAIPAALPSRSTPAPAPAQGAGEAPPTVTGSAPASVPQ
jgi:chromosome segregation ATPase